MDPKFERYYNLALRYISYRPRSEKEVFDYLVKKSSYIKAEEEKEEFQKVILKIMQKLQEHNFINDLEFAQFWIDSRTRIKPKALKVIKFELTLKGIGKEIIDEAVEILGKGKEDDLENAKKLAERKLQLLRNVPKEKREQRVMGFLQRRGFDYQIARKAIDEAK